MDGPTLYIASELKLKSNESKTKASDLSKKF